MDNGESSDEDTMLCLQIELNNTKQKLCETLTSLEKVKVDQQKLKSVPNSNQIVALKNRSNNHEERMKSISKQVKNNALLIHKIRSSKTSGNDYEDVKKEMLNIYSQKTQQIRDEMNMSKKEMLDVFSRRIQNVKLELRADENTLKQAFNSVNTDSHAKDDLKKLKKEMLDKYSLQTQDIKERFVKLVEAQSKDSKVIKMLQKQLQGEINRNNRLEKRMKVLEEVVLQQNHTPNFTAPIVVNPSPSKQAQLAHRKSQNLIGNTKSMSCQNLSAGGSDIQTTGNVLKSGVNKYSEMSLAEYMAGCTMQPRNISSTQSPVPNANKINNDKNVEPGGKKKGKRSRKKRKSKKSLNAVDQTNLSSTASSSCASLSTSDSSNLPSQQNNTAESFTSTSADAYADHPVATKIGAGYLERAHEYLRDLQAKKAAERTVLVTVNNNVTSSTQCDDPDDEEEDDDDDDAGEDSDETSNDAMVAYPFKLNDRVLAQSMEWTIRKRKPTVTEIVYHTGAFFTGNPGYRAQLRAQIDRLHGDVYFSVRILQGLFDDCLPWPCQLKFCVRLSPKMKCLNIDDWIIPPTPTWRRALSKPAGKKDDIFSEWCGPFNISNFLECKKLFLDFCLVAEREE